jgi:hypothetical protein
MLVISHSVFSSTSTEALQAQSADGGGGILERTTSTITYQYCRMSVESAGTLRLHRVCQQPLGIVCYRW